MKKKLIGVLFAATMLFGASMTVFAAEDPTFDVTTNDKVNGTAQEISMDSDVEKATISIKVTHGEKVIANPYGIVNSEANLTATETLKGANISFENSGNTSIAIGIKGKVVLPVYTDSKLAADKKVTSCTSATTIKTATTKQVYVQAEVFDGDSGKETCKLQNKATGKVNQDKTTTYTSTDVAPLVYTTAGATLPVPIVLQAAQDNTTTVAGTETGTVPAKKVTVKITGATSVSQTSPWNDNDSFDVVTTYDFKFGGLTPLSVFKAPPAQSGE